MAKKKNTQIAVSPEESIQSLSMLEQYHQIASDLHASTDRAQAEAALTAINALPEGVQFALVKELSKQNHEEAADVLIAIHELAALKTVRKEARRSLIRLEGAKIYPKWEPPAEQLGITSITPSTNPPRFWKGIVTDSLDIGEVQLLLCWEQGDDYKEIRVLGFLLEFGYDGVKDFFAEIESKRSFENMLARMRANMGDVSTKSCSLARGRRLLLQALAVNKQRGTTPHKDYRFHLSLITQLILEAPDLGQENLVEYYEPLDMDVVNPVTHFITFWTNGEYSQAYDLLSTKSVVREGLSKGEWIERRKRWAKDADPGNLEPGIIINHTEEPGSVFRKEIEVGWSIEMKKIEEGHTLPELPEATIIYEDTGRHWLWATYTLIQEKNEWLIQTIVDKGKVTQGLSIAEIEEKVAFYDKNVSDSIEAHSKKDPAEIDEEETLQYARYTKTLFEQATYYNDILLKKLPPERSNYQRSVDRMLTSGQYERGLAYLTQMTQRFPEDRVADLCLIIEMQDELREQYRDEENEEYAERNDKLRVEALQELLKLENSFEAHMSLAEVFIANKERLDEAKEHLLQAKKFKEPDEESHIERHLGEIALMQQQFKQALGHYQYLVKQEPQQSHTWSGIAEAYEGLGNVADAEANYKKAITLEPTSAINYLKIGRFYISNRQYVKAIKILKDGLKHNPDSFSINVYLAVAHIESNNLDEAEDILQNAEQITPDTEVVHSLRQAMTENKVEQPRAVGRLGKALRQKKMER